MWRMWLLQCVVLGGNALAYGAATTPSLLPAAFKWTPHNLGRLIAHCLGGLEVWKCLGFESERLLDAAALDNSTWQVNDYLSIEPQEHGNSNQSRARSDAGLGMGLAGKLLQLVQGRALRLQLPRQLSISNAIDDFGSELGLDQGTNAFNIDDKVDRIIAGLGGFDVHATDVSDKDKQKKKKKKKKKKDKKSKKKKKKKKDKNKKKSKNCSKNKTGRKKKDKDKHMAMMGGMIMMATLAQMFLGKVILIAGSAFIMAKIALVISLLGSLKKGTTGHSGSPEHVIISGGHSHESGWHRSMPTHDYSSAQHKDQIEEPSHSSHDQDQAYYAYEAEHLDRRQLSPGSQTTTGTATHGFL